MYRYAWLLPLVVAYVAFVLGVMFMPETRKLSIWKEEEALAR